MKFRSAIRMGLFLLIFLLVLPTVFAQVRPSMNVYVNWTPNQQLSSIDNNNNGVPDDLDGDDFRYVDMQIYATGNVAFWAVQISCNVGNDAIFELISLNFPDEWGADSSEYISYPAAVGDLYQSGILAFTVTRVGVTNPPLGVSGQNFTQLIATARFRVLALTSNTSVSATCRTMEFLDRDGNLSVRGRQTRLGNLSILVGYTLTGTALREGTNSHINIRVDCDNIDDGNPAITAYTNSRGNFRFGGATTTTDVANWIREFGTYSCLFTSEYVINTDNTQILQSAVFFELQSPQYNLLPIVLRAGDHVDDGVIDFSDIAYVTGNIGNSVLSAFDNGDTNGNLLINETDLVITAGNYATQTEAFSDWAGTVGYRSNHVLYGMGRDLDPRVVFPNSKIWLGEALSGGVSPLNPRSRSRDFWPQLSPNGIQIAFVSENSRSGLHELAFLDTSRGRATTFRVPRGWTLNAFAPSWSPDGNLIAYVCAENTPETVINVGYLYNRGDICIVNSNDTRGNAIFQLGVSSKIHPPAWMTYDLDTATTELEAGYVLLYGGTDGKIHYYDLAHDAHGIVPISTNLSSDVVSQPNVVSYWNNDISYLAYRYDADEGTEIFNPYIKVGQIAFDGSVFGGQIAGGVADNSVGVTAAVDGATHVGLAGSTTGVDFFDMSPSLDIIYYLEYNYMLNNFGSIDPFTMYSLFHDSASPLTWGAPEAHIPDSFIGNPVGVANSNGIYSPLSSNATYLHAHRVTFDWVP